jgi:hypothetical protein
LHKAARPGSPFEHAARRRRGPGTSCRTPTWNVWPSGIGIVTESSIGFAPLYRRRLSAAGVGSACIQPLATGRREALTKVAQVLSLPERTWDVPLTVVRHSRERPRLELAPVVPRPEPGVVRPFVLQWLDG